MTKPISIRRHRIECPGETQTNLDIPFMKKPISILLYGTGWLGEDQTNLDTPS